MTITDKIVIFCDDINKTITSVELLAINILRYTSQSSNIDLGIESTARLKPSWKSGMDITPLCIHSSLMNCFNSHFSFVSITN